MNNSRNKGFTLAELLIVVAIIAVLVAVAIPVFTAQLNKAKYATDEANARSIYAELTADYLANGEQTYTVDPSSITKGTPGNVVIDKGSDGSSTYSFNGMANITITVGDGDDAPYVTIGECDYNNNTAVVFGKEP
ncbi:type II secretion system protein [Butyrivibrio sp. XB500-5]|uniref:type II secretion system protein n=1 Tax=Butyrivibrio sp. XB500-5 TaxID=2364880 RepID=UPI000EA97229|nr:type II secretion system protein [Butyrivibrio sp. XB500-5]RKM58566.1 type II secretion system protein [Butyrivibrio sp. XB500-5]